MTQKILNGIVLDEQTELTLNDLCCACSSSAEWIIELVEEGALEPVNLKLLGQQQTQWRFSVNALQRARTAMRLQRDLGINLAGIALTLDLLDEINTLEARLRRIEIKQA
ncbi:MAG: chaperone modulator CbpM [Gammaproteobacteria bacterium]|nr:chaperone modulator CbpM [Gammaproteobacteria bacterium]